MAAPIYQFAFKTLDGREVSLADYAGKVLLLVNTASRCGFTPQYAGLEALQQEFGSQGLAVIGFPCNQFGKQEPGSHGEIGAFCQKHYGVTFTLSEKVEVNGAAAHPLFRYLKKAAPGVLGSEAIKWNFTKFLVGRDGTVVRRYGSMTPPSALADDIRKLCS
ncbi:glutathione peroxidase [Methylogaea oryzae]|uniref:Glutathione peroxidase n=1 Tax=Methylogaea oryzae TaxID=1295382 RepID=A0A8D4VQ87_9GAMM|nr:glutathione peroxidase [Methylogaea oryzae]BBL70647.1 glutathione peroxidase [Methylogaea oryzae]